MQKVIIMYCRQCGEKIPEGTAYCSSCGARSEEMIAYLAKASERSPEMHSDSTFVIVFITGLVSLLFPPLFVLVFLGSVFLVYVDAQKIGSEHPGLWALFVFLAWIIGMPWYILKRGDIRSRNKIADNKGT